MYCSRYSAASEVAIGGRPKIEGSILANVRRMSPPIGVALNHIRVRVFSMKRAIEVINVTGMNGLTNNSCIAKVFSINNVLNLLIVDHRGRGTPLCHLK